MTQTKLRLPSVLAATVLVTVIPSAAKSAGDAARGARAFVQCIACHSVEPERHLTGPSLAQVWGRRAGTAQGFIRYSEALQRSGLRWNEQSLDKWLTDPQAMVPGTSMTFRGVKDAATRDDLIAYLRAVSEGKAPTGEPEGGGMMGASTPSDLKRAPRDAQVLSLQHCRDTYILRTADGSTHKIWEYNVRLKTDSSNLGPTAGKPVVTGSGMRGDRVSIVFSSPADLGSFIKETCE